MHSDETTTETNLKYGQALMKRRYTYGRATTQQQAHNRTPAGFKQHNTLMVVQPHNSKLTIELLQDLTDYAISGLHRHNSELTIESLLDFQTIHLWSCNHTTASSQ